MKHVRINKKKVLLSSISDYDLLGLITEYQWEIIDLKRYLKNLSLYHERHYFLFIKNQIRKCRRHLAATVKEAHSRPGISPEWVKIAVELVLKR